MNAKPIIFRKGEENGIVVERDHFENSIMLNQYQQAIDIFNRLWAQQYNQIKKLDNNNGVENDIWIDNKISNIIAFCGDRGEGKSSCMASFATMLTDKDAQTEAKEVLAFPKDKNNNDTMLSPDKIEWLDVIDPSFFDDKHNLLELLLGRISLKAQDKIKRGCESDCSNTCAHRNLMEQLQRVRKCISVMAPKKDNTVYDTIEDMSDLAAGLQLKTELQKLFKCYLRFVGKECLLICIDDLDLNITEGYTMAEMLRKYLINPYCIVLVSVKEEQLIDVIATAHKKEVKDTDLKWDYCQEIARKYTSKLLPRSNRVPMPAIEDVCEQRIKIIDSSNENGLEDLTVKERVVQLIFQKTGYVFYNEQHISPIVPRNLRELCHLISTLESLPDYRDKNGDNEIGRDVFKDYFFNSWAMRLPEVDYKFAGQLSEYVDLTSFNAFVIEHIAQRLKDAKIEIVPKDSASRRGRDFLFVTPEPNTSKTDEVSEVEIQMNCVKLYADITNRVNNSTNISLGDVMFVLWLISTITVDENMHNLIFFIKTVYSMRLYACYNEISKSEDTLYPQNNDLSKIYIHKADRLYNHVNRLQRLVNGSYFSYPQGMLLPGKQDRKPINFNKVQNLIKAVDKELLKVEEERNPNFINAFQMCEYLALCLVRTATSQEKEEDKGYNRFAQVPQHFGVLSKSASVAIFDFLAPFYSVCNIKYAYGRFDEIMQRGTSLYELALDDENSLLYQMKYKIRKGEYEDFEMHGLISDAIIRVIDIQWAIFEELLRQKDTHKVGSMFEKIHFAYDDIRELNIKLYPRLRFDDNKLIEEPSTPTVTFQFLDILSQALEDNGKDIETTIDYLTSSLTGEKPYMSSVDIADISNDKIRNAVLSGLKGRRFPKRGEQIVKIINDTMMKTFMLNAQFLPELNKLFLHGTQYKRADVMKMMNDIVEALKMCISK